METARNILIIQSSDGRIRDYYFYAKSRLITLVNSTKETDLIYALGEGRARDDDIQPLYYRYVPEEKDICDGLGLMHVPATIKCLLHPKGRHPKDGVVHIITQKEITRDEVDEFRNLISSDPWDFKVVVNAFNDLSVATIFLGIRDLTVVDNRKKMWVVDTSSTIDQYVEQVKQGIFINFSSDVFLKKTPNMKQQLTDYFNNEFERFSAETINQTTDTILTSKLRDVIKARTVKYHQWYTTMCNIIDAGGINIFSNEDHLAKIGIEASEYVPVATVDRFDTELIYAMNRGQKVNHDSNAIKSEMKRKLYDKVPLTPENPIIVPKYIHYWFHIDTNYLAISHIIMEIFKELDIKVEWPEKIDYNRDMKHLTMFMDQFDHQFKAISMVNSMYYEVCGVIGECVICIDKVRDGELEDIVVKGKDKVEMKTFDYYTFYMKQYKDKTSFYWIEMMFEKIKKDARGLPKCYGKIGKFTDPQWEIDGVTTFMSLGKYMADFVAKYKPKKNAVKQEFPKKTLYEFREYVVECVMKSPRVTMKVDDKYKSFPHPVMRFETRFMDETERLFEESVFA